MSERTAFDLARGAINRRLAELPDPADQRASGKIDGLIEALALVEYAEKVATRQIPPQTSPGEYLARPRS